MCGVVDGTGHGPVALILGSDLVVWQKVTCGLLTKTTVPRYLFISSLIYDKLHDTCIDTLSAGHAAFSVHHGSVLGSVRLRSKITTVLKFSTKSGHYEY